MGILILLNIIVLFLHNYHLLKKSIDWHKKEPIRINNQDPHCSKRKRNMNEEKNI
jgi:hypothetical protein